MAQEQLGLPFDGHKLFARERYVAGPSNADALAFVKSWPNWAFSCVAIYGPVGAGKSHLVRVWQELSGAEILSRCDLDLRRVSAAPGIIEDCESLLESNECALDLFHRMERATLAAPLLLTGRSHPAAWSSALPDLSSRFSAMPAIFVGIPDDGMLEEIARMLFAERQLTVPDAVVRRILKSVERTPAAVKDFVAEIDAIALAHSRMINLGLVREMLAEREQGVR